MEPQALVMAVIGMALCLLAPAELKKQLAARRSRSARTIGRVVGIERVHRSTADEVIAPLQLPRVRFQCDGRDHEFVARSLESLEAPPVGATVALRLEPHHPETAEIDRADLEAQVRAGMFVLAGVGVLCTGLALLLA